MAEIAMICGVAKSTVSRHLKAAKNGETVKAWNRAAGICPYSPSCFTCPLADCALRPREAALVNVI